MSKWTTTSLGAVTQLQRGISYTSVQIDGPGRAFVTLKCFDKGGGFRTDGLKSFSGRVPPQYELSPGDLLISNTDLTRDGDIVGAPALLPQSLSGATFSMDVSRLVVNGDLANPGFLAHRLSLPDARSYMQARSGGSTVLHLHVREAPRFSFELPPVAEQRRITDVLDTMGHEILSSTRILRKLIDVRAAVIEDALDGNDVLGIEPLGRLADVSSGVTLGSEPGGPGTVARPYLRVANVQDGRLDLDDIKSVRVRQSDLARFELQPGDVLMNEGGDADKLGRGTVWEGQINGCLHQNHVFKVRCLAARLNPWYLTLVSGSPRGKRYFLGASKQTTNLATINSTQIKAFPVPLRSMDRQLEIVETVQTLSRQVDLESARLAKLRALKPGLMSDLLAGRVRVPAEVAT